MNWRVTIGNKQTNNRLILKQACSWSLRRQSFAISDIFGLASNQQTKVFEFHSYMKLSSMSWMFCTTTMFVSPVHDVPAQGCWWLSGASGKHLWHWPSVRRGPLRKKITSQGQQHAGRGCKNNPIIILGHAPLSGHDGGNPWLSSGKICVPRAWAGAIV